MEINQILGIMIIFIGIIIGIILGKITKEELKPGKKYILFFKNVLLAGIFVVSIAYSLNIIMSIVLVLILIYLLIFKFKFNDIIVYASFAFIYFIISKNILLPVLMFIYGFPTGSLMVKVK